MRRLMDTDARNPETVRRTVNDLIDAQRRTENMPTGPGIVRPGIAGSQGLGILTPNQVEGRVSKPERLIRLAPEYPGAVLCVDSGSANGNTGDMCGFFDVTDIHNCYRWTTDEASLQEFGVAVRIPVPSAYKAWRSASFWARVSTSAGAGTGIELTDIYDTELTRVGPSAAVAVTAAAWTEEDFTMPAGTYDRGGFITLVFMLRAISSSYAYLGEILMEC